MSGANSSYMYSWNRHGTENQPWKKKQRRVLSQQFKKDISKGLGYSFTHAVDNTHSKNRKCECGSGRKWKHCCGKGVK
jgi:uncharacterized protein YchJ